MTAAAAVTLEFLLCAAVILWSGVKLSRYGHILAEQTGLGGTWVGVVLLATVTSMPELVTGASSVVMFDVPDIAAGDAIGSCMFNMLVLALLDVRYPEPLSTRVHQGHALSAGFGIALLGLLALAILAGERAPAAGWVGWPSLGLIAGYALAMRTIFTFERTRMAQLVVDISGDMGSHRMSTRQAALRYAGAAVILVSAATLLPGIAERLAVVSGLGEGFVGSLFVAATTSLPEIAVSAAAMRLGALDMAVANLFGSNLFNVAIVGLDDVLYRKGPMLSLVSGVHAITTVAAMTMTGIAVIGLTFRAARKRYRLSWDSFAIVGIYLTAIVLLATA